MMIDPNETPMTVRALIDRLSALPDNRKDLPVVIDDDGTLFYVIEVSEIKTRDGDCVEILGGFSHTGV